VTCAPALKVANCTSKKMPDSALMSKLDRSRGPKWIASHGAFPLALVSAEWLYAMVILLSSAPGRARVAQQTRATMLARKSNPVVP
jgi:hypothetical protein